MAKGLLTFRESIKLLGKCYGVPKGPPTADPFELILWENVAYLAAPARRREAFEDLKRTIGTSPTAILKAKPAAIERVTSRGILKATSAAKLCESAFIAVNEYGGDLDTVVRGSLDEAKRALQSFPGIGEPGADKILLFTGRHAVLAPESNGLRVLVRLGLVQQDKSYARMYAASRRVASALPATPRVMQEAHLLLQEHGQTLCKRNNPSCDVCPLAFGCAYAGGRRSRASNSD